MKKRLMIFLKLKASEQTTLIIGVCALCSLTVNDDVDVFVLSSLSKTKFLNRAPASLSLEHTSTKSRSQLGVFVFCVCVYDCDSP